MSDVNSNKKISKTLKIFYGVGDAGFSWMSNIETYYFNFFLTNIAMFSLPLVTMITTIASTVDACLSWIYGILLNVIKPMKWGRYRSWLLIGPWLVPILYAFQFIKVSDGIVGAVVIIIATIASHMAWNFPYVANVAIVNVACDNADDRMALSSARAIWNSIGRVTYSYGGPAVVAIMAGIIGEKNSYGAAAFVLAVLMAALYNAHFIMFKGCEETGEEEIARLTREKQERKEAEKAGAKKQSFISCLTKNPYLFAYMLADLSKWMYSFITSGIATYYFLYVAKNQGLTATYVLISNLLAIVGGYVTKLVAQKISARKTVILAYICATVALVFGFFMYQNWVVVMICMCIAQFFSAFSTACNVALYAECAIYSEYKTGINATGTIMGFINIPIKIAVVTRGIAISTALAIGGFDASIDAANASMDLMRGISMGFMIIPAVCFALGALIMTFGYRLKNEDLERYQAEIEARKNK